MSDPYIINVTEPLSFEQLRFLNALRGLCAHLRVDFITNKEGDAVTSYEFDRDVVQCLLAAEEFTSANLCVTFAEYAEDELPLPECVQHAVRMLAAHLYQHRESSIVGVSVAEVPFAYWDLISGLRRWSF